MIWIIELHIAIWREKVIVDSELQVQIRRKYRLIKWFFFWRSQKEKVEESIRLLLWPKSFKKVSRLLTSKNETDGEKQKYFCLKKSRE